MKSNDVRLTDGVGGEGGSGEEMRREERRRGARVCGVGGIKEEWEVGLLGFFRGVCLLGFFGVSAMVAVVKLQRRRLGAEKGERK